MTVERWRCNRCGQIVITGYLEHHLERDHRIFFCSLAAAENQFYEPVTVQVHFKNAAA